MQRIAFDSTDLPGDARSRKERWVESLSSGYVRLHVDAKPDVPFKGQLKIMLLGQAAIGRISGTVQKIVRGATEIAAENTDNVVLLLNSGAENMLVGQKGKTINCAAGAAVLIEQCEPSFIKMSLHGACNFVAIQLPRQELRRQTRSVEDRFMMPVPAPTSTMALTRAYVDTLLDLSNMGDDIPQFAADHIADLVAAAVDPESLNQKKRLPNLRVARFETIRREIDRNFMMPDFSLPALARRLAVSPRYVQALFSEAATSFTEELTDRRLARAHEMLASSRCAHMSILDIAHECGFPTVSHFHRMFRRHFDATPGEVRRKAGPPRARGFGKSTAAPA
jgi:AraC-like DNA-binding protein